MDKHNIKFRISLIIFFLFLLLEIGARWGVGLGTPPLTIEHPSIDYMFAPNQDVSRFGNRQIYNAQSMRSLPLKTVGNRQLVLAFGDSVLNGGSLSDQKKIATTIATNKDTFFGNVSAGSWGPGNYRAWINEFGLFNAQVVIFVLSDHDFVDQPDFAALDPNTHPTKRPFMAISELVTRYLPRYLPKSLGAPLRLETQKITRNKPLGQNTVEEDFNSMLDQFAKGRIRVCMLFHPRQTELAGGLRKGIAGFKEIASSWKVPTLDLASRYRELKEPTSVFRDNDDIHLSDKGQEVLSVALRDCLVISAVPLKSGGSL